MGRGREDARPFRDFLTSERRKNVRARDRATEIVDSNGGRSVRWGRQRCTIGIPHEKIAKNVQGMWQECAAHRDRAASEIGLSRRREGKGNDAGGGEEGENGRKRKGGQGMVTKRVVPCFLNEQIENTNGGTCVLLLKL